MTKQNVEFFRLSWRWLLLDGVLIAIAAAVTVVTLGVNLPGILVAIALFAFLFGTLTFGFVVRVHDTGIDYGLFHHLRWQDVSSARFRRFIGLPYLFIERERGSGWWLPLYLKGKQPLIQSLAENARKEAPFDT